MKQGIFAAFAGAALVLVGSVRAQDAAPTAAVSPENASLKKDLVRGYRLKEQKRAAEAIVVFTAVLKRDPNHHAALTELGYLHSSLGHHVSAVKYLAAASAQDPENMRLHMDLGYAAQAAKKYEDAGAQFALVAARPGEFQAQAQNAVGALRASLPAGREADAKQRQLRELGYTSLNRGEKAAASKAFEEAVMNDPKDSASLKQLGFINFDEGKLAEAAAHFEAVRALEPNDYLVALQLGYTYDRLQKKEQARKEFDAASASSDEKIRGAAQAALQSSGGPGATVPASSL